MQKRDYLIFGITFLIIEILVILRNTLLSYNYYFWFCDFAPLLLAIGFFLKKDDLIKATINFGLLTQLIFLIWYLNNIIQGIFIQGRILFNMIIIVLTILAHASSILALIFTRKIKSSIKTIYWTIGVILGVWIITLAFTNPSENINILHKIPQEIYFYLPFQKFLWPPIVFLIFALPAHYIQVWIYKLSKDKTKGIKKRIKESIKTKN